MEPPPITIDRSRDPDGAVRVIVRGVLDLATCQALRAALGDLRDGGHPVRLDLAGIDFIDSTGLGVLIAARRESDADGWRFELDRAVSEPVRHLFNLSGVGTYIWR